MVGKRDDAADDLRAAINLLEAGGTMLYAHTMRRRLGQLIGGDAAAALIATAEAWMADQHIADPAAITRMALATSPPYASSFLALPLALGSSGTALSASINMPYRAPMTPPMIYCQS